VAGDQLKAASDLGVPVVGVGLLYPQGYFRQVIDKDGAQQALYPSGALDFQRQDRSGHGPQQQEPRLVHAEPRNSQRDLLPAD
jgi:glucan phosphorylase